MTQSQKNLTSNDEPDSKVNQTRLFQNRPIPEPAYVRTSLFHKQTIQEPTNQKPKRKLPSLTKPTQTEPNRTDTDARPEKKPNLSYNISPIRDPN